MFRTAIFGIITSAMISYSQQEVQELIIDRAIVRGANPDEVLRVAMCETGQTLNPNKVGIYGTIGIGQWMPPVYANHYGRTPHWTDYKYDLFEHYALGDPEAVSWDVDALAWSFSPSAPKGFKYGWQCY